MSGWRRLLFAAISLGSGGCLWAQSMGSALVRHAPTINGTVEGSVQQLLGENVALGGNAGISGDLLVPGSPTIHLNGTPTYGGTVDGCGSPSPEDYQIALTGTVSLHHVIRRTDPLPLRAVDFPPVPGGTRDVLLKPHDRDVGDFATVRDLTLNGNAGPVVVPPGVYGEFVATGGGSFVFGTVGSTQPVSYSLQRLVINGNARLDLSGPVEVTVAKGVTLNGRVGSARNPTWLTLNVAAGDVVLNGGGVLSGWVTAPKSAVSINGNSQLVGGLACDRLIIGGGGRLRVITPDLPNRPPTVVLTSPIDGTNLSAPASVVLGASASDGDGSITRVEFYQGATKLGESSTAPYQCSITDLAGGLYVFTARAYDNRGAVTESAAVTVAVSQPSLPLAVALTAPTDDLVVSGPADVVCVASAVGGEGGVVRVEFFSGGNWLGAVGTAPYEFTWPGIAVGDYLLTATATDAAGHTAISAPVALHIRQGLPFSADFETTTGYIAGPLTGQSGWRASSGVLITGQAALSGASGVLVPAATPPAAVEHDFASAPLGEAIMFVDFFARPVAGPAEPISPIFEASGAQVAFVNEGGEGKIRVFNGDGAGGGAWQPVEYDYTIQISADGVAAWCPEFGLRFDLARKTWDLVVDGLTLSADLGLTDNRITSVSQFVLYGHSIQPVAFDLFTIGFSNPAFTDTDKDGMDDSYEQWLGLDPAVNDRDDDPDHDDLTNIHEYVAGTNPFNADTDGDGMPDGWEVRYGLDPWNPGDARFDPDHDGALNLMEYQWGGNPLVPGDCTDGDQLPDGWEIGYFGNLEPVETQDPDRDGLANLQEYQLGTNPIAPDTDRDGIRDGDEVAQGADPLEYFNGRVPMIELIAGDRQKAPPGSPTPRPLVVAVRDAQGQPMPYAPVSIVTADGAARLLTNRNAEPVSALNLRASNTGEASNAGTFVFALVPDQPGQATEIVVSAGPTVLRLACEAADHLLPPPPLDFEAVENPDNTVTFSWYGGPGSAQGVILRMQDPDGTWRQMVEIAADRLPAPDPQGRFRVTVPKS